MMLNYQSSCLCLSLTQKEMAPLYDVKVRPLVFVHPVTIIVVEVGGKSFKFFRII